MMVVVSQALADESDRVDPPAAVRERLEAFGVEVLAEAMNRPVQLRNGSLYLRGLIERGERKSLEPLVERLGGDADYQSMQQFLADSPWDPTLVVEAVAERVAGEIDVEAWVLDDTGFPKDGKDSPGVKRQYSGTLGKIGNCQIGVSVHAVGSRGTVPLGWALYLPEEWCNDAERRKRAKIPQEVVFKTKPELGVEMIERAGDWNIPDAPVLGDCAYGDKTELRRRLDAARRQYVLGVSADTTVFAPETIFAVPEPRKSGKGGQKTKARPDRKPESIDALIARQDKAVWQTVTFRDGPDGKPMTSRFCFLRVRAGNEWEKATPSPAREEWLIAESPEGRDRPTDYWISNLPTDAAPEQLARLARLRWKIELDYKQLKGEVGLDHYEGRSWLGWYHHTALVTATHGFLTLERLNPFPPRPA